MDNDPAKPADPQQVAEFWESARPQGSETAPPQAWAFGATVAQAGELLALVLAGTKTATASALWDYEADGEPLPAKGQLDIVLDGDGVPRALIRNTSVRVVPFDEVDADHAWLEGEGDRSLETWQQDHESFFTNHASHDRGFTADMPVVLERFELIHPLAAERCRAPL